MDSTSKKVSILFLGVCLVVAAPLTVHVKAGSGLTAISGPASVTSNGWTSNTNAYGITDNNIYATAAPGKNATITGDWGTYGFDSTIPAQATITKVEIIPQYKVSTTASIATLKVQAVVGGTACPTTALSQTTEPTTDTEFIADVTSCRTWTRADLLDSNFRSRIAATRGNTNTAVTFSLDYVKVQVTYSVPDYNQSSWRAFQNTNSTNVGSALAPQNTPATLGTYGSPFRIRMLSAISTAQLLSSTEQFKLQYAGKGAGTCAAPTGSPSAYTDVSASTPIAFYDNPSSADNTALTTNLSDPTNGSDTIIAQTYVESNPISAPNAVPIANDGEWDFSLVDNNAPSSTTYCLRMVHNSGTTLEGYTSYPEITTAAGILQADIVDGAGAPVGAPTTSMSSITSPFDCTTSTGTLGDSSQKIRINNTLSTTGWSVSAAPTAGSTALWSAGSSQKYDFNDPSNAGCSDGSDGDGYAGQMSINPSTATITPQSGCSAPGVTAGANTSFSEGSVNSITLLTGSTTARGCYWDITGLTIAQKIPSAQAVGSYAMNITITILAN